MGEGEGLEAWGWCMGTEKRKGWSRARQPQEGTRLETAGGPCTIFLVLHLSGYC